MKIYQAVYTSRHFCFETCETTPEKAIEALKEGLRRHAVQYDLAPDWWRDRFDVDLPDDEIFEVWEFELGVTYRDHQPMRVQ